MAADVQRVFYERFYAPGRPKTPSVVDRFVQRYEVHRIDVVAELLRGGHAMLDVGCGDGRLLFKCADRFWRHVGIDITYERLRTAQHCAGASALASVSFLAVNIDRGLPFLDATFDAVAAVAVMGFVFDPLVLLDEMHRVLRPGGQLVLEVLNLAYLPRRVQLLFGGLPRHTFASGWDGGHLHNFTQGALRDALAAHGFEAMHWTGSGVLALLRRWWPSLLTGNLIVTCRRI
jgi:ubiquinone/menaquinone biosynthesis C-methylase UbiE